MVFQGINFNDAHWQGKTLADFIKHEKHHGLSDAQMKEAFELMVKPEPKKEAVKEVGK